MPIADANRVQLSSQLDWQKLGLFTTVAAGQTSGQQLPKFWNYFVLWLRFLKNDGTTLLTDAEIAAAISEVRLTIDGTPFVRLSASQIQMLNALYNGVRYALAADSGYLPIFLAREWMFDLAGRDEPAWGASGLNSLAVEFDQAGGGLAASCVLFAECGPAAPLGRFISILPYTLNSLGSGESPIFNVLPQDGSQSLYGLHLNKTTITDFSLKPDGRTPLIDHADYAVWKQSLRKSGLTPAAATWSNFPFVRRGRHTDAIPLGDPNMQFVPTFSGAPGTTIMLAEIALEK